MVTPSVAVIIVSYNGLPIIQKCLPSVVQTDWDNLRIIFVDNHSSDQSIAWVQEHFPNVEIMAHPDNWLFSRANNEAIESLKTDYVILLNNDVEVSRNWLSPLVEYAEKFPQIGALQPKILHFKKRDSFEYAGACGGFLDQLGYPFARGRIFETTERDTGQYDAPSCIDWASGAAMLLRRSALEDVGLLDELFGLHMEEIDLCWRLRRFGYQIGVVPQSTVYHMGGATLSRKNSQKLYYNIRNSILMLYKNLPPLHFRKVFLQRIILDHCAALMWLIRGQWKHAFAVMRGYLHAHKMRYQYSPPSNIEALPSYNGRVLFDYLISRKQRFSDLAQKKFSHSDGFGSVP
ncbi:MAG: glycosyltransferase family 2 protein [Bacteroidetes bacterium]|nr:glycosyltransferase family 2 protein [Bacteroidota bacterium]